jgi:hypothetical protein
MSASRSVSMNGPAFSVAPLVAGPTPQVLGTGTFGRLTKWTGVTSSNSVIGDSTIFEDKFGKVGIGTDSPGSRLTVMGLIESMGAGGVKFPDGTIQTSSASGALTFVNHDTSLIGGGTAMTPLGVNLPLDLNGGFFPFIVRATNTHVGDGVLASGGPSTSSPGGNGVIGVGGNSNSSGGGGGVIGRGGLSDSDSGGDGVTARGGGSTSGFGGNGVDARAGGSASGLGGKGVDARGGDSTSSVGGVGLHAAGGNSNSSNGGDGVFAGGGNSILGKGGTGLFAIGGDGPLGTGRAGSFVGDVLITGNLSKGGGSFKIDHPLDPENKYLYHSFVESPDMKNIYDGVAALNSIGEAVIELPEWFQALNRDFRYLLTAIGGPMPGLFIAEKIKENRFRVAGGQPGMEVSWQVTGIRRDAFANKNRIKVEEEKPERERGHYLHPEAFDQPEELGIEWVRNPEMMKQRKDARQQEKPKLQ